MSTIDDVPSCGQENDHRRADTSERTATPKLVMGEIICMGPDDEESIPYDEAVIHLDGDEDSEIRINCPGALRLAPAIVEAVNNHARLISDLSSAKARCEEMKDLAAILMAFVDPIDGTRLVVPMDKFQSALAALKDISHD